MLRGDRIRQNRRPILRPHVSVRRIPGLPGAPVLRRPHRPHGRLAMTLLARSASLDARASSAHSQLRAAYDGSLVRGPTKEEMADTSCSDQTRITCSTAGSRPRRSPAQRRQRLGLDAGPRLRRLEDHDQGGHRSRRRGRIQRRPDPLPARQARRGRKGIRQDRQEAKRNPRRRRQPVLSRPRLNSSAELLQGSRQLRAAAQRLSRKRLHRKAVAREYEIAQLWFAQDDPKTPKDKLLPWYGRFDGRLPLIDVQGNGLKALEHVRQNNPSAPSPTTQPRKSPSTT